LQLTRLTPCTKLSAKPPGIKYGANSWAKQAELPPPIVKPTGAIERPSRPRKPHSTRLAQVRKNLKGVLASIEGHEKRLVDIAAAKVAIAEPRTSGAFEDQGDLGRTGR